MASNLTEYLVLFYVYSLLGGAWKWCIAGFGSIVW